MAMLGRNALGLVSRSSLVRTGLRTECRREMSVRIRLARFGRKKRPFYRIRVANARSPRDGKFLETVGTYDPLPSRKDNMKQIRIDHERVKVRA